MKRMKRFFPTEPAERAIKLVSNNRRLLNTFCRENILERMNPREIILMTNLIKVLSKRRSWRIPKTKI